MKPSEKISKRIKELEKERQIFAMFDGGIWLAIDAICELLDEQYEEICKKGKVEKISVVEVGGKRYGLDEK